MLQGRQAHQVFTAYSLDAPLSDEGDPATLVHMLGDDDSAVGRATDIDAVHVHLGELPEREQRILMLRLYGNLTQDQILQCLGISQMHVSRILAHALTYLREHITGDCPDNGVSGPIAPGVMAWREGCRDDRDTG